MSYSESDYLKLILAVADFLAEESNPLIRDLVIRTVFNLMLEVPLYPGLLASHINDLVKDFKYEKDKNKLIGENVIVEMNGETLIGKIKNIEGDKVLLKNVHKIVKDSEVKVENSSKIKIVSREFFYEKWPTLDFRNNRLEIGEKYEQK